MADASGPDYTLEVTPATSQTVTPGGTVVYDLTLTPRNGSTGTVSLLSFGAPPDSSDPIVLLGTLREKLPCHH